MNSTESNYAILDNGQFYFPASKHYTSSSTNVCCDRCNKSNLAACIGYQKSDLCLVCANELINNRLPIHTFSPYPEENRKKSDLLDNIIDFQVDPICKQIYPCLHDIVLYFQNGTSKKTTYNGTEIYNLYKSLNKTMGPHFEMYGEEPSYY